MIFDQGEDSADTTAFEHYDLPEIEEAGVLIGITLSGPDTYYEYHGQGIGTQFQLAEEFARSIGARLQMEIAPDTATLLARLNQGEVDFVAMEMPPSGMWLTRPETPLLEDAITQWWDPSRKEKLTQRKQAEHTVKRSMRPLMKDRQKGIISQYDDIFVRHAASIGWDWRLLAAQCYQESGFDPKAQSWVGAKGLMQLMPATARQMGVPEGEVFDPEQNITAAARYIKAVQAQFTDIPDPRERLCYVLGAYNGGSQHIRDAMALTRKHGSNPLRWDDVAEYVLKLADPAYYRDPVVKRGYMRGSETEAYVRQIMERWADYRGSARAISNGSTPAPSKRSLLDGKFQTKVKSAQEFLQDDTLSAD